MTSTPGDSLPEQPPGNAVLPLGASAVESKAALVELRRQGAQQLATVQKQLADARAEMDRRRAALEADFAKRRAELEQVMAPLQAELARIQEMAWTVDLYLGRDEELTLLRDGEPASADEPITVRQMVLAMDEESLVLIGQGGLDGRSVDAFLDWLVADDSNLNRVLPDPKSVVVMVPTRQQRDYGNVYEQAAREDENSTSHWLIRNGGRLYVLVADIKVGDRLLPTRSEFVDYFYAKPVFGSGERVPMEPGSEQWLKAEKAADARRRHFMRIMLVLQGLIDRTVAFHPLPEGGVNLLSLEAQDSGKVRLINELDLALESSRRPFRDWQRELNSQLRPGMRIIGDFGRQFSDANDFFRRDRLDDYRHSRLRPNGASRPESCQIYLIEDRAPEGGLVIRYQRTDTVWRHSRYEESGEAKVRASCVLYPRDRFILPFDLVTVEDLNGYLHSREDRKDYLSMVPVLRAALEAKIAEEAAEAPFRLLLAGTLASEHDVEVADIEAELPSLVLHWKLANRWARPLVLDNPAEQSRVITAISTEWAARRRAARASQGKDAAALATAASLPDVMAIGRRRDGRYVAYAPSAPHQNVWLDEYQLTTTGKVKSVRRWVIPTGRSLATLTMLRTDPAWTSWNLRASRAEHISGPEAAQFAEKYLFPNAPGPAIGLTMTHDGSGASVGWLRLYAWADPAGAPTDFDTVGDVKELLVTLVARWKRDQHGQIVVVPKQVGRSWVGNDWAPVGERDWWQGDTRLSHGSRLGMTQEEAAEYRRRHGSAPSEEVLVWLDDAQWAGVRAGLSAVRARLDAERAEESRLRGIEFAYTQTIRALYEQQQEDLLRERFRVDYGTDDDELWANYRKSVTVKQPHERSTRDLIMHVLRRGGQVAGRTLAELAAAYEDDRSFQIPEEWADLVIPELPDDDDD